MEGFTGKTGVFRHAGILLGMELMLLSVAKSFMLIANSVAAKTETGV